MRPDSVVYVAGHRGLAGSALVRRLRGVGDYRLVLRTRAELDLEDQRAVRELFEKERIDYVFLAAALAGGILANRRYPADFIRSNLLVQANVIDAAYRCGVRKLLFLGSSCVYPREAPQPIREEALLTGPLEPTNEPYAIAKIAGIKMCQAYHDQLGVYFVSAMPTNLYGPGDSVDPERAHVIPALMRRFHDAKISGAPSVTVWGTGTPRREFLHVDDFSEACLLLMARYDSPQPINVGTGSDVTIADLAALIARIVGYDGAITFDPTKPDGVPRKRLDVSKLKSLGWQARIGLEDGLRATYDWYVARDAVTTVSPPR